MSRFILTIIILSLIPTVFAQDNHQHDHSAAPAIAPAAKPMQHQHSASPAETQTHSSADIAVEHDSMAMQSSAAPDNARDPHAYSGGFTQTDGPFVLLNSQPMMHGDQPPIMSFRADQLEYDPDSNSGTYDLQVWRGTNFNRLILKSEGAFSESDEYENETELLWGHAVSAFWDSRLGARVDSSNEGKNRQWLAAGIMGLAPYWFELDATAYIGTGGQSEFVAHSEYDLLLTQRLILQPSAGFTVRGKDDPLNLLGSGLSSASIGFRLRYEYSRQFAPYIGFESEKSFGSTADLLRNAGSPSEDTRYFAGLRLWF